MPKTPPTIKDIARMADTLLFILDREKIRTLEAVESRFHPSRNIIKLSDSEDIGFIRDNLFTHAIAYRLIGYGITLTLGFNEDPDWDFSVSSLRADQLLLGYFPGKRRGHTITQTKSLGECAFYLGLTELRRISKLG